MPESVHLLEIALARFRNHRETRLAPGRAPFVLLTGPNGAGKTNILEAVSLLAVGRGLRGASLSQMAAQMAAQMPLQMESAGGTGIAGGFSIRARLEPDAGLPPVELMTFTRPEAPDRRELRVNGARASLSSLSDWCSILWLTPAMDRLFADAASARRRFLDRLVLALNPGHAGHASRYEAAMRARTRLLVGDAPADPAWLSALEAQMAGHGAALAEARASTVAALSATLAEVPEGAFPRPGLAMATGGAPEGADALAAALAANRAADRAAGRATMGPHRADLVVVHAGKPAGGGDAMPAALASTGEQKALLLSILLAHARLVAVRTGRTPLLLLDEAVAHLDPGRRLALFDRLAGLGCQSWLTGTEPALFAGLDAAHHDVADGVCTPVPSPGRPLAG
ncbi:DNA replication/repair protein RecF [Sandaracinobacteroides sp. A072]|uniref:DNA replication/repair protein RecF n=1 Tax=Sandaracinobacteroides sp. A072 TaxID=3461146 RepID=UPI004040EE16